MSGWGLAGLVGVHIRASARCGRDEKMVSKLQRPWYQNLPYPKWFLGEKTWNRAACRPCQPLVHCVVHGAQIQSGVTVPSTTLPPPLGLGGRRAGDGMGKHALPCLAQVVYRRTPLVLSQSRLADAPIPWISSLQHCLARWSHRGKKPIRTPRRGEQRCRLQTAPGGASIIAP